jgi:ubiquinone/menaquinone biosynthesis C-methylase UbiE
VSAFREKNRAAWNRLADGSNFAKVASDEECANPLVHVDGRGWLPPDVRGWNVLCLAAGGGWQSILYASAGANVTVVDLSPAMLRLDEREAAKRRLSVKTIETSMDDLSILNEAAFDVAHQPVSTCYVPKVEAVYREVARVLKDDGLYISQHKSPVSLQVTHKTPQHHYVIGREYYHEGPLPACEDTSYREDGTMEYLHRYEQLIGGLCRAGFVIEDLVEPYRADKTAPVGHFRHRGRFIAPYVRMKARRLPRAAASSAPPAIWVP